MNTEQQINAWVQVMTKAGQDGTFRNRLLDQPEVVLAEYGVEVPAGVQVHVIENTDQVMHLALPRLRTDNELSDAELEGVAGGLVVPAIIAILRQPLLPREQVLTPDQLRQVAAGNPLPRPR